MQAFCTRCWSLISTQDAVCPECGAETAIDKRSFEEKLVTALNHPLPSTRARICWLLGQQREPWCTPHLVRMLDDPDLFVQMAALRALGDAGDASAIPVLEQASKQASLLLRIVAAGALQQIFARLHAGEKTGRGR